MHSYGIGARVEMEDGLGEVLHSGVLTNKFGIHNQLPPTNKLGLCPDRYTVEQATNPFSFTARTPRTPQRALLTPNPGLSKRVGV